MADKPGRRANFRVEFDDAAFAEDLAHASSAGRERCEQKRADAERDGQAAGELIACDGEGRDGTRLPGCFKTYVPWPTGRWGMVLELRFDEHRRPYFAFLAFGVRHRPRESNTLTVYQVAHRRLHSAADPQRRRRGRHHTS